MSAVGATGILAACASPSPPSGAYAGAESHHFSELRLGRQSVEAAPPRARPAPVEAAAPPTVELATSAPPAAAAPTSGPTAPPAPVLAEARRRLVAFLGAAGFSDEDVASPAEDHITATRMTDAAAGLTDAVCGLKALHRPEMYATTLNVRLAPSAAGVQVGVQARFEEIDQGVISGALSKRACASRGVLEAQVRRAALGG